MAGLPECKPRDLTMARLPECKTRDLTSVLKALPGKVDIKRYSPSILFSSMYLYTLVRAQLVHY